MKDVRVLVTGSRNWTEYRIVYRALFDLMEHPWAGISREQIVIVHGGARGADDHAERAAKDIGYRTELHRPDYKAHDPKVAPLIRNDAMLDSGVDLVLAFMLGTPERGGTLYTVNGARQRRIPIILHQWPGDPAYQEAP
jgi:YspA, cpYpsA-related SLOG family